MADIHELKNVLIVYVQHLGRNSDVFQVASSLVKTLKTCVGIIYCITDKKRVFFRKSVHFLVFCCFMDVIENLVELASLHHLVYG